MEQITSINPNRILWSCRERGIDIAHLAADVQISERTLTHAIRTSGGLTFNELQKLAKYFNRGVLFFLEPGEPQDDRIYSPQFRTLANQNPQMTPKVRALIQRAERQREVFLGLREELGEEAEAFDPPASIALFDAESAAEVARKWLSLSERNSFETYRNAVESRGVLVFRTNGYGGAWQIPKSDDIEGFCLYNPTYPIIVVKKQDAEARQTFTLFHELGHLLLHKGSFVDEHGNMRALSGAEHEANRFAGNLLVPEAALSRIDPNTRPVDVEGYDDWLRQLRTDLTVSSETILRRMLDSRLLSRSDYESYRAWRSLQTILTSKGGSRQYRHREPLHVFGATFARTVLEALNQQRITSNMASRYLDNLKISDLRQLEAYVAAH